MWFFMDNGGLRWDLPPTNQFTLQEGLNVIEFALREDGTGLDKIYLTKNLGTSVGSITGFGAEASNCLLSRSSTTQAAETGEQEEEKVKVSVTNVYPNPLVGSELNLTFNQELSETLQYRVYDNWGRIVTQGSVEVKGDQAKISFRGAELTNGNLMLIIEGETLSQQRLRFIKSE
jgi:ribosomal protein S13